MSVTPPGHPAATPRRQWPVFAVLTLGVVVAHWALLLGTPLALATSTEPDTVVSRAFTTRNIAAPPPPSPRAAHTRKPTAPPVRSASKAGALGDVITENVALVEVVPPEAFAEMAENVTASMAETPSADAPVQVAATELPRQPAEAAVPLARTYAIPGSVRLQYDVNGVVGFPYTGGGELLWSQDGKTYDSRLVISKFGFKLRIWTSTGTLTPQGLEPTRFGDKTRSEVAAHFERAKNKVSFSANTPDAPLLPGAQDHLSVFMQLASMLAGDAGRFAPGTKVAFQAVGARASESWVFVVGTTEKQQLPGGDVEAIKLTREPSGQYSTKVEVWLAPTMEYIPVHIRLSEGNGDFADLLWSSTHKP